MKYKLILFDLDGTLFDYETAEQEAFYHTFKDYFSDSDMGKLKDEYVKINRKIWQEFENGSITAENLRHERFSRLFEKTGMNLKPKQISKEYLINLGSCSYLLEGALEIISYFHDKCQIALITNGLSDVQHQRIINSIIAPFFEHIFISEEIGYAKPHPGIFEFVFEHYPNIKKEETIIVGDNLSSDIKGGKDFGIDTCWFNPKKYKNNLPLKPTYEIQNLAELKNIVFEELEEEHFFCE